MQRWANLWKPILGLLLLAATVVSGLDTFVGEEASLVKRGRLSPPAVSTSSFVFTVLCVLDVLFIAVVVRGKRL